MIFHNGQNLKGKIGHLRIKKLKILTKLLYKKKINKTEKSDCEKLNNVKLLF